MPIPNEVVISAQFRHITKSGWSTNANHQKYLEADGLGRWPNFSEKRHVGITNGWHMDILIVDVNSNSDIIENVKISTTPFY